jgi:hypothetical protein
LLGDLAVAVVDVVDDGINRSKNVDIGSNVLDSGAEDAFDEDDVEVFV